MNTTRIAIFGAILLAIAGYGFHRVVLGPKAEERAALDTQIADQQTQLTAAQRLLADNTAAKAGYSQDLSTVLRLGKAVPEDDDTQSLVYQLAALAHRSSVAFKLIEVDGTGSAATTGDAAAAGTAKLPPGAAVGTAGFPVMPFKFSFTGRYFELASLLRRIRHGVRLGDGGRIRIGGRLLTLDSIDLSVDEDKGFPNITAEIGATAFLLPADQGVTASAPTAQPGAAATTAPTTTTTTPPAVTPDPATPATTTTTASR